MFDGNNKKFPNLLLLLLLADAQQWIGHLQLFSKVSGKVVVSETNENRI